MKASVSKGCKDISIFYQEKVGIVKLCYKSVAVEHDGSINPGQLRVVK